MVYCGKPSRGCQMCRTRRIKCDETKPTCNQCAKSRRQCPGYKDEFDLVFRNETQATERRAKKANMKALEQKQGRAAPKDARVVQLNTKRSPEQAIVSTLQLPVEQQATCHFISNFVLLPRQGTTRGFMEFVVPLMKVEDAGHSHFRFAFDACALASLSNRVGSNADLDKKALGHYTKALAAMSVALDDPDMSKQDSTLAAILLLSLFENITAKQMGMLAWGSHVEGAIQLVKTRGKKQLRTKIGLTLFVAVRTMMIIHTLSTGKAPIMGVEWWVNDAVRNEYATHCQRINIRTGELRAKVNRLMTTVTRSPENVELMLDMIRRCQMLDRENTHWADNLPDYFSWKTVAWKEDHVPNGDYTKAEAFPGRLDAYKDLWVASVWNMMRCARLIIMSLIVRCAAWVCSPVDYRTTPEYATAARTCVDTITDIIASVPYQFGYFSNRPELLEDVNLSSFGCGQEDAQKGLPGYFLTWPLACILGQDYTTDAQRAWAKGRLVFIGNQLGVRYAHLLIQLNIRIPSMLIRRDGLMNNPFPGSHNFEKMLSSRTGPQAQQPRAPAQYANIAPQPTPGQLKEAEKVWADAEAEKAEMKKKKKAMGASSQPMDPYAADAWFRMQSMTQQQQ